MDRSQHVFWLSMAVAAWGSCWPIAVARGQFFDERQISPEVSVDEIRSLDMVDLERVAGFLADSQWDEAVQTLRRVLQNHGDKLILAEDSVSGDKLISRYITVRQYGQRVLASWKTSAPQALAVYRNRTDPSAERWLREGIEQRDETLLQQVVDQALMSRWGDDALWQLGEYALERGQYTRARALWERISPLLRSADGRPLWLAMRGVDVNNDHDPLQTQLVRGDNGPTWLAYPDTDLNLADVRARLTLVSILEGSAQRAAVELEVLRRLHGDAGGQIGGQRGKYGDLLAKLLEESQSWPSESAPSAWTTFGGDASRNAQAPQGLDIRGPPIWSRNLPNESADNEQIGLGRRRIAEDFSALLSYHPLVVGDVVLLNEMTCIKALKLHSGAPAWPGGNDSGIIFGQPRGEVDVDLLYPPGRAHVGVPRYTMTVHGGKLFARMGAPLSGTHNESPLLKRRGYLVGLDLRTQKLLFDRIEPDDDRWAFEGAPLCDGTGIYVAMRRSAIEQARADLYVACFDVRTGRRRWRTMVCGADSPSQGKYDRISHLLLTLSEGVLYCNTNLGAIAAISVREGAIEWVASYTRAAYPNRDADRNDMTFYRDLNPCIFYKGLVIAAPADCDRIFALDAASGWLIWKTPSKLSADAVHLLGVGSGNLLLSGDSLYWIDVATGRWVGQFPQHTNNGVGFARASPAGFGRGLLAGEAVYWPTRERIFVLSQETRHVGSSWQPVVLRQPIDLIEHGASGGNLLIADGVMLIAAANKLYAFDESGRRPITNKK